MSELSDRVAHTVMSIPAGRVMTYGDIAHEVHSGARAVARAVHGGGHDIPWWRVVNAEGRPYPGAAHDARARFEAEATPLHDSSADDGDVRVDLARASWSPRA